MASLATLRRLHSPSILGPSGPFGPSGNSVVPTLRADSTPTANPYSYGSGNPYDSGSTGRRLAGWQPTRLGPTTSLWATRDLMLARCRDEVRNNPWATSAVDNFESQVVGNGIKPKWNIQDEELKIAIEKEFHLCASTTDIDYSSLSDYYGQQALIAREVFEGGETLVRRHVRPDNFRAKIGGRGMRVPLQFQIIESEQMPIWLNISATTPGPIGTPSGNIIRTGIEFDKYGRRVAYHMYREHPGETMFYSSAALTYVRVPADQILHIYKPFRAGLLRGQPHLSSVLLLLHELTKYTDATVVAKQIQTMFAGFVTKTNLDTGLLPPDPGLSGSQTLPPTSAYADPGTRISHLEPGTLQDLTPGENIVFPTLPQNSDLQTFLSVMLHQFSVAIGATYEQITGDLRGVNLSSIRAGIQDAHRKVEQFVYNILVAQFCEPMVRWWLDEAVLSGRLRLPGYAQEPEKYLDITWNTSGWPWLDPLKDVQAKQTAVRSGFTSREMVCAETGEDAAKIDAQQSLDNARADREKLIYDSDPRKILVGREANPQVDEEGEPEAQADVKPAAPTNSSDTASKSKSKPKPKLKPKAS